MKIYKLCFSRSLSFSLSLFLSLFFVVNRELRIFLKYVIYKIFRSPYLRDGIIYILSNIASDITLNLQKKNETRNAPESLSL